MSGLKKTVKYVGKSLKTPTKTPNNKSFLEIITVAHPDNEVLESPGLTVGSYSKKVKGHVEEMKKSASIYGIPSVSARQYGFEYNIFLMAQKLSENVWTNYGSIRPSSYEVFINPRIEEVSKLMEIAWEECPSLPNIKARVRRYEAIRVSYLDEELDEKEKELRGFPARVFQHEMDHLLGLTLVNWKVSNGDLEIIDEKLYALEEKEIEEELKKEKEMQAFKESLKTLKKEAKPDEKLRSVDDLNTNDDNMDNMAYFDPSVAKNERDKTMGNPADVDRVLKKIVSEKIGKSKPRRKY